MTVRAISAKTGISIGAVHRAKRQIEKIVAQQAAQKTAVISLQPPPSLLVKQDIDGIRQDVRRLSVSVYERAVSNAFGRGLLGNGETGTPNSF